jgi:transposase-like protein
MKNDCLARRYSREEILEWIRRYRASGLALGSFAEQHGLSRHQLHYWVYDRRYSQAIARAPVFQEIKVTAGSPMPNWAAEISWPTGVVARFSAAATPAWINSVLEGLGQPC